MILRRRLIEFSLLAIIAINIAMMALVVSRSPEFFSQNGAHLSVLEPTGALFAYAVAIVIIARMHGPYWNFVLRAAIVFGVFTGMLEVINIGIENGVPFNVHGAILPIGFMFIVFTAWGIAGFRTARSLRSIWAGLLAAMFSAGICMIIAVTVGFIVQFFLIPPKPAYVSSWAEFKRSGWTNARAFGLANTLDSGFTHLIIAPMVALVVGGLASLLARSKFLEVTPTER